MFSFNPELANTDAYDDGDEAFDSYSRNEEEDDDGQVNDGKLHLIRGQFQNYVSLDSTKLQICSLQYFDLDVNALGFTIEGAAADNARGQYRD